MRHLVSHCLSLLALTRTRIDSDFAELYSRVRKTIDLHCNDEHPHSLSTVVILVEDRRFLDHPGVDLRGIVRALFKWLCGGRLEGASTIEQQLVRTITNERDITLRRKFSEALLAMLVAKRYSKQQVLGTYLSVYPFGGVEGARALAEVEGYDFYNLSWLAAMELAARLKYPVLTSKTYIKYLKRVRTIEVLCEAPSFRRSAQQHL